MQKQNFSPLKYLKEKGKLLPIEKCLISDNYENLGLTICLIIRRQPSGKFSFASILVDRLCLGVKDVIVNCNYEQYQLDELMEKIVFDNGDFVEVTPEYFHNMVYGALDYAEDLGFKPAKDFYQAEYLLDETLVNDDINLIEMGYNGEPFYIPGPFDSQNKIASMLAKNIQIGTGE